MEQVLGINKLAGELQKNKPNEYIASLDKLMKSDKEEDFDFDNV